MMEPFESHSITNGQLPHRIEVVESKHLDDNEVDHESSKTTRRRGGKVRKNYSTQSLQSLSSNQSSQSLPNMEIDLENGYQEENLQEQSNRLSRFLTSKTELATFNQMVPEEPKEITVDKETSGIRYWIREAASAKEHGGDYAERSTTALRASLGALITFSVLVLPEQTILGAVWIANIFMHCNIKDSFGSSLDSVIGFGQSILLTTVVSWLVAYLLTHLDRFISAVMLPFIVFIASFVIMSCPQLVARNLMVLVMFLIVAMPIHEDFVWWVPLGWTASYLVGLLVALLVNVFPWPKLATWITHKKLKRLETDLTMLLIACKTYADNTGTNLKLSRSSMATIEFMYTRIVSTVGSLKKNLPAAKVEMKWMCKGDTAIKDLSDWVDQSEKLLKPLRMLRSALMQRVLGEEHSAYSAHLREAKLLICQEVGPSRDRLVSSMIAAIAVCHAWADPSEQRKVLPDVQGELKISLRECQRDFHRTMVLAAEKLGSHPQTNVPIFAHLVRRMSAFSGIFSLAESLLIYLEKHNWEATEIKSNDSKLLKGNFLCRLQLQFNAIVNQSWLWHGDDSYRLALKTAAGMLIASIFVSIQYLYELSAPFSVWPGLTIASVNLGTTGSSFHKAGDRLFGTLLAAAYAMLVSDLFPGTNNYVKIAATMIFTYIVIFLRNSDHEYKYTYAATSIGSMLFGSEKIDYDIAGYIPKRIEMIFMGAVIFTLVELLLFPRSSRKIVEGLAFQYFLSIRDFLRQAHKSCEKMNNYVSETSQQTSQYTKLLIDKLDDPFELKVLSDKHEKLKKQLEKIKKELDDAIVEPNVGLALPIHPESFRGLVSNQQSCELHAAMFVNALHQLAEYYQIEGHLIREMNWPSLHTGFLSDATNATDIICQWLKSVFPDGRIRAQGGSSVKAVSAASSFRTLEDVRLKIIADWSKNYQDFFALEGFESSDPVALMTLGNTTSLILELCRNLQKAGKNLEEVAYRFPARM